VSDGFRTAKGWQSAVLLALLLPGALLGQQVTGRVVLPNGENPIPVPGKWVVLHRIAHDTAGPLDSVRTDRRGGYTFSYPRAEDDSALYLVSASHGGVAYFTQTLRPGHVRGEAAEIMVFDTTSVRLPIRIQGRHFIVAAGADGRDNEVLEVYELSNDTSLTAVSPKSGRAIWTAIVPERARNFRLGQGDVSEGGLVMRDGKVHLFAPIAPGLKQLSFRYNLPRDAFPLSVPITQDVGVLEVVADDPGAQVSGAGLREMPAVQSEGRTFKRFLSQDVHENAVVRIALAPVSGSTRGATVALLGGLFAASAAGAVALVVARRKRNPVVADRRAPARDSEKLVRAIAELDARFETTPRADTGRAAYEAERQVLKERLREALAREPGRA
jgi:hypothetical protein